MFAEQYYEFVELAETEEELLAGKEMPSEIEAIEANKVTFQYEEQGKKIFAELSLRLKRGDKIALVGPNGAGKSTFVNLLLNLYQPQNGILTCNGEDIREYEQEAYRNRFSLIFQESNLYPCSVEENLLFRKCVDETEKRRLYEVLDKVGLGEKVRKLPFGLQTPVTKEFDKNGVVFSGGECQRMALARAILQDAAIFVMDEPSSALDPEMELQLNKLFAEVLKDKTLLIISHRISTIAGVDYIYMLNRGQVAEAGTHQELMKKNGDYAKIYRAQEELYRIG